MKISRIQIDGILGITSIDVRPATAIQLFAGDNFSGKSSIRDSVIMAISGKTPRDVNLKKNYALLVNDGVEQGGAVVTMDNDMNHAYAFNMPTGKFDGREISESMRVALDGQRFASMAPNERRTFILELTKKKPSAERVKAGLLSRKCDPAKIEAVLPLLRTGMQSTCEHAKTKATEAKGAWRVITGGTYGPIKAPEWEAPKPYELPDGAGVDLATRLTAIDASIATNTETLGSLKQSSKTATDNAARRESLKTSADKVPDLQDQLTRAKAEVDAYLPKVEALRARAGGVAKVGLVHDMAKFIHSEDFSADLTSQREADVLLTRYEDEHGKIGAKVDTEAQASLPEYENGLKVLQNRAANLQRDLDSATQAKGQFDALAPAGKTDDASADIAELAALITGLQTERATVKNQLLDIESTIKNRAEADKKTADALAKHNDVAAWTLIADAMDPDGIPSELLSEALAPVNATLDQASMDAEWMQVVIGKDMEITGAGRPYCLLSESEKWRVDAMIAQTVSEISGLKILILDRMDVLGLQGRAQLLDWLDILSANDLLDTALLFATLKAPPTTLAESVQVHWIEKGAIAGAGKDKASA